jgi:hypothetical protein
MRVDPLLALMQRLMLDALVHEVNLLLYAPRTRIEVVDLAFEPVKADGVEGTRTSRMANLQP